jgi:hypothetical protein
MTRLAIIRRAMRRALQWRLLVVSSLVLFVAAAATLFPLAQLLGELFDHSPRWRELTALDSPTLMGLLKASSTPAFAQVGPAVKTSLILGMLFSPFLAGAALCVAEASARPNLSALVSGAAGYYGRLLRMQLAAIIPFGAAGALAAVAFAWASGVSDRATSEAATHTSGRLAWALSVAAVFVVQLVVDAGRARLVAEPERRSVLFALGAGLKLVVKRPLQALALGASSTVLSLAVAAVFLVIRQQLTQSSGAVVLLALVFAQLGVASIAWGHAARLCGLVEIARELAARERVARDPGSALRN